MEAVVGVEDWFAVKIPVPKRPALKGAWIRCKGCRFGGAPSALKRGRLLVTCGYYLADT